MAVGTNKGSLASSRQDSKSLVVVAGTTCPPCALNWMRPRGGLSTQAWNVMFGPNFPIPSDTLCPLLLLPCLSASPPPVQLLDQTERRQQIPVIFCTSGLRGGCSAVPIQLLQMAFSPLFSSSQIGSRCPLIASALIFGTLLHTLVEIGQQPWCDKHEKTSESWIFIASEGLRLRLKAKHQSM